MVKRLIKHVLRAAWRAAGPLRRPLERRVEGYIRAHVTNPVWYAANETNLVLDHVVREMVRLQEQVEELRAAVEELAADRAGLSLVNGDEAAAPVEGRRAG